MTTNASPVSPVSALRIIYTWATHDIEHGKKKALEPVSVADLCERALKSATSAIGGVPNGFVLVPEEATKEMCKAAVMFANGPAVYKVVSNKALEIEEQIYAEAYEAMLSAAPTVQGYQQIKETAIPLTKDGEGKEKMALSDEEIANLAKQFDGDGLPNHCSAVLSGTEIIDFARALLAAAQSKKDE